MTAGADGKPIPSFVQEQPPWHIVHPPNVNAKNAYALVAIPQKPGAIHPQFGCVCMPARFFE